MRGIGDHLVIRPDVAPKSLPRTMLAHSEGQNATERPSVFAWLPKFNEQEVVKARSQSQPHRSLQIKACGPQTLDTSCIRAYITKSQKVLLSIAIGEQISPRS